MALGYRRPAIFKKIPRDQHAVIEASAGTGKTYLIEHLVLDLLLTTTCSLEEILVVTFTEKATAELRGRIRTLLESSLSEPAPAKGGIADDVVLLDDDGRRKIETALFAFDRAPIWTIHAFCQRILTDFAFDTGTGFGLEVIDSRGAFHRSFRNELREVIAVEESARILLDEWMAEGETARQPDLVGSLEDLLRQAHFNRYLETAEPHQNELAIVQLAEIFDHDLLKRACLAKSKKTSAKAIAAIDKMTALIERHREFYPQLRKALGQCDFRALPNRSAIADHSDSAQLVPLISAIDRALVAASLDVRVVDAFLPLVSKRLLRDKRENGEIDYADMLAWVWDALDGPRGDALAAILRKRFRYALVDEFQDTDDLQWKIFQRIFVESGNQSVLYVVGDPKQAIYGFRGADVFTYLEARQAIVSLGAEPIRLTDNFRSEGNLITALNAILRQDSAPSVFSGEIKYDAPVKCGRPDLGAVNAKGTAITPVTLLRYCPGSLPGGAAKMRVALGRHIASEIRRILFDRDSIVTVSDENGARPLAAKDIYILTRSHAEANEMGRYLRERGIPFAFYKKVGLFQTPEAYDVLDILKAVEDPSSRSKRLKAWVSPFFAVPYPDLFGSTEVPAGHSLDEQLYQWKVLADQEQFATLFDQLLHQSGLVSRELFLSNSERELTNYLHIFEILLELIVNNRLSLCEVVSQLGSFIAENALPAGVDSNIQRIESERSAVQIMSIHMSKGLEANVVFLFGGTTRAPDLSRTFAYHDEKHVRRIAIGKTGKEVAKEFLDREAAEENQRLAYVAMTRARVKLYLPVYPNGSTRQKVSGYYEPLNDRLTHLTAEIESGNVSARLFEIADVRQSAYDAASVASKLAASIASWTPPESLMVAGAKDRSEAFFDQLRARHRPMQTRSYTTLESRAEDRSSDEVEEDTFKYDREEPADHPADLRGGRNVGIFLHEVIEQLDLKSLDQARELEAWRARDDVRQLFANAMRRHQVGDARWFERGTEIVFNALTGPIATSPGNRIGPLYKCNSIREMEFVYPIPERKRPKLQSRADGVWAVDRGYLKGFVDFIFEHEGLYYFADWKSDLLATYERARLAPHVRENYDLQAIIYTVGIVRLLQIRNQYEYEQRFGGLLYLFVRGMRHDGPGEDGVYFRRPGWNEVCLYERSLIGAVPEVGDLH